MRLFFNRQSIIVYCGSTDYFTGLNLDLLFTYDILAHTIESPEEYSSKLWTENLYFSLVFHEAIINKSELNDSALLPKAKLNSSNCSI